MFDKYFNTKKYEPSILNSWSHLTSHTPNYSKKPFCIILPPPNVTGSLHIGHALCFTIQDVICRYKRLTGFDVLWQPGTDHAAIVTEMLVTKQLSSEGINKFNIGREKFLEYAWKWKEDSENKIIEQMNKMGFLCAFNRNTFTLEDKLVKITKDVFIKLYQKGLIYRDKRMVNWDIEMQTAISDLEVVQKEQSGKLYYIKYITDTNDYITIATTRPETIFADAAIAVNILDERYNKYIGSFAYVPIINKKIPIIADDHVDIKKGSGALKVTPAHDFYDFDIAKRNNINEYTYIFDKNAKLINVPELFANKDRFEARKLVIQHLEELNLVEKIEDILHSLPYGDRSGTLLEPMITEQWFVDVKEMANMAINLVQNGSIEFSNEEWVNTYMHWMKNITPWCISRQLWWGHRIPVWYAEDGKFFVAESKEMALEMARKFYNKHDIELKQDEDVLDTWFSSALWPFVTLDWPNDEYYKRYYPTDIMITGFDILFFWIARMIMFGNFFTEQIPFKYVLINPIVRDQDGQKMSKSKGNVIDPISIIDEHGCDALRFALISTLNTGRSIKIGNNNIITAQKFITKIWNAAKFIYIKGDGNKNPESSYSKWIRKKLYDVHIKISQHIDNKRLDLYAIEIYKFMWDTFCDWYIEFSKIEENNFYIKDIFMHILQLLNPIVPFITEAISAELGFTELGGLSNTIITIDNINDDNTEIDNAIEIIKFIRSINNLGINVSDIKSNISPDTDNLIIKICKIKKEYATEYCDIIIRGINFSISFTNISSLDKIAAFVESETIKAEDIKNQLSDVNFIEKANTEFVNEMKDRLTVCDNNIISMGAILNFYNR